MSISIALSGGGASGLGHIPALEAIDDLGLTPEAISGASMGALIGAAYAGGMSGRDIRAYVLDLAKRPALALKGLVLTQFPGLTGPDGALSTAKALELVWPDSIPARIEDLKIPLTVAATDYYGREAVLFRKGPLLHVLGASIAIPGVFRAVRIDGTVYVDGGVTNNLPIDALPETRVTLAVDTANPPPVESSVIPSAMQTAAGSMRIMFRALMKEQLPARAGLVVVEPASSRFGALDYHRAAEILDASEETRDAVKRAVEAALAQN